MICEKLNIESILLANLRSLKAYNEQLALNFITYVIYSTLIVNEHVEQTCFMLRLIASNRVIEFESSIQLESWQFISTRLENLDNSISKVEINNSSRFLYLKSKFDSKNRLKSPKLSISIKKF